MGLSSDSTHPSALWNLTAVPPHVILLNGLHNHRFLLYCSSEILCFVAANKRTCLAKRLYAWRNMGHALIPPRSDFSTQFNSMPFTDWSIHWHFASFISAVHPHTRSLQKIRCISIRVKTMCCQKVRIHECVQGIRDCFCAWIATAILYFLPRWV